MSVELTETEKEQLFSTLYPTTDTEAIRERTLKMVESIVAARTADLQARLDRVQAELDSGWTNADLVRAALNEGNTP